MVTWFYNCHMTTSSCEKDSVITPSIIPTYTTKKLKACINRSQLLLLTVIIDPTFEAFFFLQYVKCVFKKSTTVRSSRHCSHAASDWSVKSVFPSAEPDRYNILALKNQLNKPFVPNGCRQRGTHNSVIQPKNEFIYKKQLIQETNYCDSVALRNSEILQCIHLILYV